MFKSIKNCKWEVNNRKYYDKYNKICHPVKRRFFEQKETGRIIGEATIGAVIKIIEYFKPIIWVIENPQTSKSWLFQREHWNFKGHENKAFYSSYDNTFSLKPTIFKSNVIINFNKIRVKSNNNHMANGNYNRRSMIPLPLIKDMIEQIDGIS